MPRATVHQETIAEVPGFRFTTDARPGTAQEAQLQEIQSVLAEGVVLLPSGTTLPHLNLAEVQEHGGGTHSIISLWVPAEKRSQATELLEGAGFTVSEAASG